MSNALSMLSRLVEIGRSLMTDGTEARYTYVELGFEADG